MSERAMTLTWLEPGMALEPWAQAMQTAEWDDGNDLDDPYTAESLAAFLADPSNLLVVAHTGAVLLGMASASLRRKPYGRQVWLYIDEVDVAVPHRRRGVGKALMRALLHRARGEGCEEVWLGTEPHNTAALALYRSLDPVGDEAVVGFTWQPGEG